MKVSTHIKYLDQILDGGFKKPSAVLVAGHAGAGKTTLCMQSLFNAAKNGESCVYISVLSETPAMVIEAMSQYSFFDNSVLESGRLNIFTIPAGIIEKGDFAIFEFINEKINTIRPSRVVIDPITILEYIVKTFEERPLEYPEKRSFVINLFEQFEEWDTLLMMTAELQENELSSNPWSYMVDSVIKIGEHSLGKSRQRYLEVLKMRGTDFSRGEHTFKITGDGITVFPRLLPAPIISELETSRISTGIKKLDTMMGGGIPKSSATLLGGGAGCGKTVLGLHFIANGILNKKPCLIVSFEDDEKQIINFAEGFGLNLKKYEQMNILRFISHPYGYVYPDEVVMQIKEIVDEIGVERILIDSISGFNQAIPDQEELRIYIHSLIKYFKNQNITSIFTYELPEIVGEATISNQGLPFIMDSILLLRNIEIDAKIKKSILILKTLSEFDNEIKEFKISSNGIKLMDSFNDYSGLMSEHPVHLRQLKVALTQGKKIFMV